MAQPQERARITEVQVRIDCNGCVQKIKKALQGIKGISDVYIDLPRQKLTIIGTAEPERIIKAIKKARKTATIYSHSEVQQEPPPTDPKPEDSETPAEPPADQPEPPKDQTPPPPPSEPPKDQPPPPPAENPTNPPPPEPTNEPPPQPVEPNEAQHHRQHKEAVEEVQVIHHHPPDYRYRPGYSPGYNPNPPRDYGYVRDYSPEQRRYGHSYGPGYNPGPPSSNLSYSSGLPGDSGYEPGYNPGPPGNGRPEPSYIRGAPYRSHNYDRDYSPEQPHYSQSYGPGYNPGAQSSNPGYSSVQPGPSQGYEPDYNPGPPRHNRPEPSCRPERLQPVQVTHSYNQYRPPPNVTQYEYVQSPPRFTPYARNDSYYYYNNGDYQNGISNNNNGYASSIFSEENPNACTIS